MKFIRSHISCALCILLFAGWTAAQSAAPSDSDVHRRAVELLARMTLEEKAGQLNQLSGTKAPEMTDINVAESIKKGQVGSVLWLNNTKEINRLQHLAVEGTRMHIPLLVGFDVIHGYRVVFPVPLAMASSWDPSLEEAAQRIAAEDSRAVGINWIFTPMVDIVRDARWARLDEGAGEDPYLGSAMARAQVRGLQNGDALNPEGVLACVKHFAGYGASEGGRDLDSADIPETLLWNVYLKPFHAAEQAGVGSFMSAYVDLNDVPASGNRWLLHDVLRQEWGFRGFVVSDAFAVHDLVTHGYASDPADAAYKALTAGMNMDMDAGFYIQNLPRQVTEGKISMAQLDEAVLPILEAKIRLGLFEHPYVDESKIEAVLNRPGSREFERKVAVKSMVLLRNEDHALPLSRDLKKIAIIGPLGTTAKELEGSWNVEWLEGSEAPKGHTVSVMAGLKNKLGAGAQIEVVEGPELLRVYPTTTVGDLPNIKTRTTPFTAAEIAEWKGKALAAAKRADVVIAVMGESANMTGDGSRATLDLPGLQEQMLEAAASAGKPVVLVLVAGRPLDLRWASQHIPAILQAWYPGSEGGNAIADVLFGDANPGGKLPLTWPLSVGQEPIYYNHNLTSWPEEKPNFTSLYWDMPSKPLYPFGYGLSYSTFEFKNLRLNDAHIKVGEIAKVQVDVTNTSRVEGDAVTQIYIHQRAGSASRPVRQLEGFQRVTLKPGETKTLEFPLGTEELSFWDPQTKTWKVEPGVFDVWAGGDSRASLHAELGVSN